MAVGKD